MIGPGGGPDANPRGIFLRKSAVDSGGGRSSIGRIQQISQCPLVDFLQFQKILHQDVFILHVLSILMPREIRSKGHHIGHGFGISPSADGNRTAVVSGHFPVSGQQGAQHRAVRRPPGRLFPFSRLGVCVRKPILLTLQAGVRKLRRRPGRPLCSPLPANPYAFVSGSKIFTQLPAAKCIFARTPAGLFAPPGPQILMPSFRGAKTPAAVPNRCRGFSISLFLCYILISSMPAFPHTHRRCTAYP